MGKYMKKARGVGGVMEVMTQGQLGVRTRARAQAIEKKELIRSSNNNNKVGSSTSTKSFAPAQISYLELRSRRLEKTVGYASNKPPPARKATSADARRQLSDLTNSDILADDSSNSRLALSTDAEARRCTRRQTRHQGCDENREFVYHFHGDNEAFEAESLQGCARSLQQWRSRGRAPPGAAHSRSNSRSNSVTRELTPPTRELPSPGMLTRNQRKMEKEISDTIACGSGVADMEVELDAFCNVQAHHANSNPNSDLARSADVEVSCGENPMENSWFARDRLARERTPISNGREAANSVPFTEKLSSELTVHKEQAAPCNVLAALDMEIEDFFLQAEQQEQRGFIERYNYDPLSDTPLPGRFDWVAL